MHGEDKLAGLPLAMAYVPMQEWRNLYDLEDGFDRGTLFRELDFPFYPTACPRKGCR
ncbi:MAG: spore coat associated protein CotJA [Clostridiales bacterium]|nr:spore coat associated protein CotJA [Clostridiales bacterium]